MKSIWGQTLVHYTKIPNNGIMIIIIRIRGSLWYTQHTVLPYLDFKQRAKRMFYELQLGLQILFVYKTDQIAWVSYWYASLISLCLHQSIKIKIGTKLKKGIGCNLHAKELGTSTDLIPNSITCHILTDNVYHETHSRNWCIFVVLLKHIQLSFCRCIANIRFSLLQVLFPVLTTNRCWFVVIQA